MTGWDGITFDPLIGSLWLLIAVMVMLALTLWLINRRIRGSLPRLAFVLALTLVLANPQVVVRDAESLNDIVLLVTDRSESQTLADRRDQTDRAQAALLAQLEQIEGLEIRKIDGSDGPDGTQLMGPTANGLREIPTDRLSAIILLSDGLVHDNSAPIAELAPDIPIHALISGDPNLRDRRINVVQAPEYALVDRPVSLSVRLRDDNAPSPSQPIPVTILQDGQLIERTNARPDVLLNIPITPVRRGPVVVEVAVDAFDDEVITNNNRIILTVNAVRDRLKVLLVSGEPHPGERVWRDALKADPAVDLIHFTILRLPTSQDPTPADQLSLIPFPTQRLFDEQLDEFDLVIFDRYTRRGVLDPALLNNLANYVLDGGAILIASGPEFADPISLYNTALAQVLPARPTGRIIEEPFAPQLTERGQRHPVTTTIRSAEDQWGNWYRYVQGAATSGDILMQTPQGTPLLILGRPGDGRVAQLMTDQVWLWARGVGNGGPYLELLRRTVHWLMKEPDLEEESLTARIDGDNLVIERRSMTNDSVDITLTGPDGAVADVALTPVAPGLARAQVDVPAPGLYQIGDGQRQILVAAGDVSRREMRELVPTQERLAPLAQNSGGAVRWLADGVPNLRRTLAGATQKGSNWIGIPERQRSRTLSISQTPLLPPWLAVLLLAGLMGWTWWRESH